MPLAEQAHCAFTDANPFRVVQVCRQFRIGPIGPVQATAGWALLDPGQDLGRQALWDTGRATRSPTDLEAVEATDMRGVEPTLQRPHADAEVFAICT